MHGILRCLAACLLPLGLSAAQVAQAAAAEDPWSGKTRTDVENLLGEPSKTKTTHRGTLLTYKLLRLDEEAIPPPSVIVLDVPGIGVVARMQATVSMTGSDATIAPTEVDERGRGTGGGVVEQESATITWDTDSGEVTRSWEEKPAIRGKLTLKFEIDAAGRIKAWSVSPKKAARR